ncbi:MAG: response regulator [Chitinophagaceae bacterium]|nr:MAG: response regulator [Chitinophagaceae bacterium]
MVVCVDDDKEDADFLQEVLNSFGVLSKWHQDGMEVFQPLDYEPSAVRFILLDIDMPVHNGFDILGKARDSAVWSKAPIIVFSGSISHRDITRAFLAGATFYMQKPNTFERLTDSVKFLLGVDWKNFQPTPDTFVYKGPGDVYLRDA